MENETQAAPVAANRVLTDSELDEVNGGTGGWNRVRNVVESTPIPVVSASVA